ncbi:phosphoadenylyl-sulfate reductase [Pseudoroseicyclus aestuarii]|uniref:Adenosine 5'-phosphosulfate reductase n=1 Tax=Pseudoroseicyclus aestuarii TaxID=1795041 RepID=A0A318SZQ8_9RHOB|nr:phosphoadenylyl-sulfate reductase [Pseudoroseicyclus aestuarii]PYE85859.1 phosphoadenylylsulfate reductase (thioredoxin) [Pseudoroseicyclus aestuarii]
MPRDLAPAAERAPALNARYRHHGATAVLERALRDAEVGRTAMVSSFGAESVALLHLVAMVDRHTPVLFIDTEMLFAETLTYQQEIAERMRLSDLRILRPAEADKRGWDPDGTLHLTDPDSCCAFRKTGPLQEALGSFDAWITGRKRYQSGRRATLDFFEPDGAARLKINPLAHWTPQDVQDYMVENRLPRHPLVAQGYPSIGCAPCTSRVAEGEDQRSGRWRGRAKDECGIHFEGGKPSRAKTG